MRSFVEKRRAAFFIEKSDIFLKKSLDISSASRYNNTRRQGHGPRRKEYADVAELADALDSGSSSLKRVWVQIPSSAPKSSNVCSGIFCFAWDDRHRPLRRCRRAALHIHKMSAVQIHLSHQQKHFFAKFFPRHTEQKCLFLQALQLYSSCNLHRMRYNVDCHASRLCGRLQTAHAPCKTRPTIMLL